MSEQWKWRRSGCRVRGNGRTIATVNVGFIGEDELNEHGHLIAAAPQLKAALDHECLRQLFAAIEDSGTPEATTLWGLCMQWFDVRDEALRAANGGGE